MKDQHSGIPTPTEILPSAKSDTGDRSELSDMTGSAKIRVSGQTKRRAGSLIRNALEGGWESGDRQMDIEMVAFANRLESGNFK